MCIRDSDYPRGFSWRSDEPATVTYIKALDGGLGKSKSKWRDAMMVVKIDPANPSAPAVELFKTTMRYAGVNWGDQNLAVFYEESYATRKFQMNRYNPATGKSDSLYARSSNDSYSDIGSPLTQKNKFGRQTLIAVSYTHLTPPLQLIAGIEIAAQAGTA